MGKKSRKKKASNKESHQNRMKERAARREEERKVAEEADQAAAEHQAQNHDDGLRFYSGKARQFMDGDFVRWYDPEDENRLHRGVISSKEDGSDEELPQGKFQFQAYAENAVAKMVDVKDIYTDIHFTQLQYKVGDRVLCLVGEDEYDEEWVEHEVVELWPRPTQDQANWSVLSSTYPLYVCKSVDLGYTKLIYGDTMKNEMMDMPLSTRFEVGDEVVFNGSLAEGIKLAGRYLGNGWKEGKVVTVLPTKVQRTAAQKRRSLSYMVYMGRYECSFQHKGKVHRCYILHDTDEHIARDDPRTRLMNAIEDDCSLDHLSYLVDEFGIDISSFQELLYLKALDHASYNALWWMEERLGMEVDPRKATNGEVLIKHLSSSPKILRFMQNLFEQKQVDPGSGIRYATAMNMLLGDPSKGDRTGVLSALVGSNTRELDYALCPLALAFLFVSRLSNDLVIEDLLGGLPLAPSTAWGIRYVIDRFNAFRRMDHIARQLRWSHARDGLNKLFKGPGGKLEVQRYLRFCWDYRVVDVELYTWESYKMRDDIFKAREDLETLCENRVYRVIHLIVQEDPSLLSEGRHSFQQVNVNMNEFSEPKLKLWDAGKDRSSYVHLSLVESIVNGRTDASTWFHSDWDYCLGIYHSCVRKYMEKESFLLKTFIAMLTAQASPESNHMSFLRNSQKDDIKTMFQMKIAQLSDDDSAQDQLNLLDYLVIDKGLRRPDPFFAIKVRQCSVIRWLFANNFVNLSDNMDSDFDRYINEVKNELELNLLTNKGFVLSLATIQYDDLQSLVWLVENFGVGILVEKDAGFNSVHASAHFGRIEIMYYLKSLSPFDTFMREAAGKGKYSGWYASHIATACGHTTIADMLLSWGCPLFSKNNISISDIASKSKHDFVRNWNPIRMTSFQLQADVDKLLMLAMEISTPLDAMKAHVLQTKCMEIQSWKDADCYTMDDDEGGVLYTFNSVIEKCLVHGKVDFCLWLCTRIISQRELYSNELFFREYGHMELDVQTKLDGRKVLEGDFFLGEFDIHSITRVAIRNYEVKPHPLMNLFSDASIKERLISKISKLDAIRETYAACLREARAVLFTQYSGFRLEQLMGAIGRCGKELEREDEPTSSDEYALVTNTGKINFKAYVSNGTAKAKMKPLQKFVWTPRSFGSLHILLPLDGDIGVIQLCLERSFNMEARKEITIAYLASCLNRPNVVELLCGEAATIDFCSSVQERNWYAALGAIECGRFEDIYKYLQNTSEGLVDPIKTEYTKFLADGFPYRYHDHEEEKKKDSEYENHINTALVSEKCKSVCYFYIHGFLVRYGSIDMETNSRETAINEIATTTRLGAYERRHFLLATLWVLDRFYSVNHVEIVRGVLFLVECLIPDGRCTSEERTILKKLTESIIKSSASHQRVWKDDGWKDPLSTWVEKVTTMGIALSIDSDNTIWFDNEDGKKFYEGLEQQQKKVFQQFDGMRHGQATKELQKDILSGKIGTKACDRGGLYLVHQASAYDRLDIMEWLIENDIASLDQLDSHGRSVLEIAESSKAKSTTMWIRQRLASAVITKFVRRSFWKKRARKRMTTLRHGMSKMQAVCRGSIVRQKTRGQLLVYVESSRSFQVVWDRCIELLRTKSSDSMRWSSFRDVMFDFVKSSEGEAIDDGSNGDARGESFDDMVETLQLLDSVIETVQDSNLDDVGDNSNDENTVAVAGRKMPRKVPSAAQVDSKYASSLKTIQYTQHVVKWLRQGDPKYRDFFARRITQLSEGERSRILAKRLKGSKAVTIYETYLEQKSGFRILWTEDGDTMLVWYVAKHDNVSRMVKLIDDSYTRGNRQLVSAGSLHDGDGTSKSFSEDSDQLGSSRIVLDPFGNVPMKIYEFGAVDVVGEVTRDTWTPRLKLTHEERDVVETKGTVLLLGRSGTGKTVCVLSRMDYDREAHIHDSAFTQMFVARSRRLCKYVSEALGQVESPRGYNHDNTAAGNMTFTTFNELLSRLENALPKVETVRDVFLRSERMTFQRFKTEVYNGDRGIDPLLAWACIRSFLKGSIEATTNMETNLVDRESFLSLEVFGSRRCRLSAEKQRPIVFDIFEKYQRYMQQYNLWDDCDRIMSLLQRLESCKTVAPNIYDEVRKRKIYVDEIQDYTQSECLLFFYLSGPGDLFFAGDPAQSVVEGVEFRFEEIRSVEYHIAKNKKDLLLQKPKTVNVNYRSHAGILNTAGAILTCMFGAFPHSAKQLKEDKGVFVGPRPGVMYKVPIEKVESVINTKLKGTVILVNDSNVSRWRRALGGYALVYGIRAAKGLEFKSVMVLGFFGELPFGVQKPWRDLLLGRADDGYQNRYPEVEGQMKLLYTAVTRSIERLVFVETEGSVAGDAFVRWVTTTSMSRNKPHRETGPSTPLIPLASRNKVDDVESMAMTRDEWLSSGMDNAEAAEIEEDLSTADSLWDKAIYCFREAQDHNLARKARTHRSSVRFQMRLPVLAQPDDKQQEGTNGDSASEYRSLEVEGASVIESLLYEGLREEAKNVCLRLIPYMSEESVDHLQRKIIKCL